MNQTKFREDLKAGIRTDLANVAREMRKNKLPNKEIKELLDTAKTEIDAIVEPIVEIRQTLRKQLADNIRQLRKDKVPNKQIRELVNRVKDEFPAAAERHLFGENSMYPIAQEPSSKVATESGLPIQDPNTPKEEKLSSITAPSTATVPPTQSPLISNPALSQSEEKQDSIKSLSSKIVISLLKQIEKNTRDGVGAGNENAPDDDAEKESKYGKKVNPFAQMLHGKMQRSELGRVFLNSTDAIDKLMGGVMSTGASKAKEMYQNVGGLSGMVKNSRNWLNTSKLGRAVNNAPYKLDKMLLDSKYGDKYFDMQWAAKEKLRDVKNVFKTNTNTIKEKITNMNPFRSSEKESVKAAPKSAEQSVGESVKAAPKSAEQSFEESQKAVDPNTEILKKLVENTDPENKKNEEKDTSWIEKLSEMFSGGISSLISSLMSVLSKIPAMLGGLGSKAMGVAGQAAKVIGRAAGPAAALAAAGYAGWEAGNWLNENTDIQKHIASGIDTVQGWFGNSDKDKMKAEDKKNAIAYYEEAKQTGKPISKQMAEELKSYGVDVDPSMIAAKATPAASNKNVPEAVTQASNTNKELDRQIAKADATPTAAAPTVNSSTSVTNNTTTQAIRFNPRNYESSWMRYMEGRYAV